MPRNGTMPNNEPRKIKTFTVHGDQADAAGGSGGGACAAGAKPAAARPCGR